MHDQVLVQTPKCGVIDPVELDPEFKKLIFLVTKENDYKWLWIFVGLCGGVKFLVIATKPPVRPLFVKQGGWDWHMGYFAVR